MPAETRVGREKQKTSYSMKKILILALGLALSSTFLQAEDAPADKVKKAEARRAEMLKKYDKNGDGQLDETEKAAAQEERRKEREQERLKKYDKNGDGKLDETEKEAMREDLKKRAQEAGARRKGPGAPGAGTTPPTPPALPAVPPAPKN